MAPIDYTASLKAPMLGIFGNEDRNPNPEQVNRLEAELKRHGKSNEFHRYDGAGHGFFGPAPGLSHRAGDRRLAEGAGVLRQAIALNASVGPRPNLQDQGRLP